MKAKFILILLLLLVLMPFFTMPADGQEKAVTVYFFWGDGCSHCEKEKTFLEALKKKYPEAEIKSFEVWKNKENRELLSEFGDRLETTVSGVPFTVIGDKHFVGYLSDDTTGQSIENTIKEAMNNGCQDVGSQILEKKEKNNSEKCQESRIPETIKVPLIGKINIEKMSLPVLTVVFGLLDGFNPCSMWALIFLISLLINMGDKKRLLILGSIFIITSAVSYFLFMSAWLNLFLFLEVIVWVRIVIGLAALGSGYYNLKEYFKKKEPGCEVSKNSVSRGIIEKLKDSVHHHSLLWAGLGIIGLAFAVNLIELICSAGFPAVYTQVLALNDLPTWKYYSYILGYVFFYDLDEIIVLILALLTFKITVASSKYTRWSHLIGGILMLILGLLLIFRHQWLMFG